MTEKDKIELMRRFEPFGREIPKDQVMSVIARVPTESFESEKHQLQEEIPTNTPTKSTNISTDASAGRPKGESLLGTEMSLSKWIPCSERLPKENEVVLTQARFADDIKMAVSARIDYNYWTGWGTREVNVVAWMPLPKPFGERSEE